MRENCHIHNIDKSAYIERICNSTLRFVYKLMSDKPKPAKHQLNFLFAYLEVIQSIIIIKAYQYDH